MFHSGAGKDHFSNSSQVWNIKDLGKLLRIPKGQLNLLNNIAGWSTKESGISEQITVNNKAGSECILTASKNLAPKSVSNSSKTSNIIISKEINCSVSTGKNITLFDSNHKSSSLKKSTSVDFLNKLDPSISYTKIKRFTSLPDMTEDISLFKTSSDRYSDLKQLHLLNDQGNEKSPDLEERLQFMDSAVQCKMSQSSQPNVDIPLASRIALSSVLPSSEKINSNICKVPLQIKAAEISTISATNEDNGQNIKSALKENVNEENLMPLKEKSKLEDEIFVSQPFPCAQPLPAGSLEKKGKSSTSTANSVNRANIHGTSFDIKQVSEENNQKLVLKRKRKNKQEKITKKFRSMGDVEIHYSLDQIKNMIELIKCIGNIIEL